MRRSLLKRPSPGLILACVALFVALGGGAYAATSSDKKTDKKIAKKAAKSYFKGHIGGASVSHANTANSATNATNATNASNATRAQSSASTDNLKTWFTTASAGQTVTLLTVGPFTYTGACTGTSASPSAEMDVTTSQANSWLNSYESSSYEPFNPSDGAVKIGENATGTSDWEGPYDGSDAMLSGDGHTYVNTFTALGTGLNGVDCTFVGHAVVVSH